MLAQSLLSKSFSNASLLVADRVVRYGSGFVITAAIARYLGPVHFGELSFVLATVAVFLPLLGTGMDAIVIRDCVESPQERHSILGTNFRLRLWGSVATIIASCLLCFILRLDDWHLLFLTFIMSAATAFLASDVFELWFQSQHKAQIPIYAKGFAFVISSGLKIVAVVMKAPLDYIIAIGFLEALLGAVVLTVTFGRDNSSIALLKYSSAIAKKYISEGWKLMLAAVAVMVCNRADQLIISGFLGDERTGIYAAAFRFTEFAFVIPTLIAVAAMPVLSKARSAGNEQYSSQMSAFYNLMTLAGFVLASMLSLVSGWLIPFVFGPQYSESGTILGIQIWAAVFAFLSTASNQYLVLERRTGLILFRAIVGASSSICLNVFLIPIWGLRGAALSSVLSNLILVFCLVLTRNSGPHLLDLLRSFRLIHNSRELLRMFTNRKGDLLS